MPAFAAAQLTQKQVKKYSATTAKVRIHVKHVIGLMKNRYTIIQGIVPVNLVEHATE